MAKHHHTRREMRSIVKNPNNPAYAADLANRISLGHQNVPPPPPAAAPQPASNQPEPKK
jgi:hypothetical protein